MNALMLANTHADHATRSGYTLLADYMPEAELLTAPRRNAKGFWPLLAARLARRASFSRWYIGGSALLEWKAWKRLRTFNGIVHWLWTDHDLGYLDFLLDRSRHKLCGTFHNSSDTFIHTIRFPRRLRRFDAIVLMSETQRPFFLDAGVKADRIHVVLHGVDVEHYTPANQGAKPFHVLSVGGYRRNFPLLREVCAGMPDVLFRIIGPEEFRPLFSGLSNATFLTEVGNAELLDEYRKAGCLLHTAENATANNAVLEAMACGVPIVAERIGGIPEYVTEGCGLLTPPRDAAGLVQSIQELLKSRSLHEEMSAAARARAEELDWRKVAETMRALYQTL